MKKTLRKQNIFFNYVRNLLLVVAAVFIFNPVNATNWYVNDGSLTGDVFTAAIGDDANPGTAALPFATIQFAINAAAATGDTIFVDAGTYVTGDIDVNKSVALVGAKHGVPAGPAAVPAGRGMNETIIQGSIYYGQSKDNISVDGFTINMGTTLRGIEARGLNSVIVNNIVSGTLTPLVQQAGILTRANAPNRTHSYLISHNNVRGLRFGIYMDGNTENPSEISYNYVTGCFTDGYSFTASNGHHIKANVSENNGRGMEFSKGSNLIDQNTIIGNIVLGIRLAASPVLSGNNIINNFFINNTVGLALTEDDAGSTGNTANYNSFTGNFANIASTHSASLNAQCNWYGTIDPVAIAATINGNINFNPYLTDGTDTDPVLDGFQPVTVCIITPVILTSFTATIKNYDVILNWQTASEVNSSHYIIERSLDNHVFTGIGRVEAKGFSDTKVNYNFTDNKQVNFDRPTYYRIAMYDRDGTKKYSNINSVVLKTKGSYVQQVYPNPAKTASLLHVNFISGSTGKINISFVNAAGQVLQQRELQVFKGGNDLNLIIPVDATRGINFLLVRSADGIKKIPLYIN